MSYRDLAYNAHGMLKDYYTYEEITMMPLSGLFTLIEYFRPKLREIARQQQSKALELELTGKNRQMNPNGRR